MMSYNGGNQQPNVLYSTYSGNPDPPPMYQTGPQMQPVYQYQQQQGQPQVVIMQQPLTTTIVTLPYPELINYGLNPVTQKCPHCRADIVTRTEKNVGSSAWICCIILFLFGCWPCYFLPFCICKDVTHKCPNCNQYLGQSKSVTMRAAPRHYHRRYSDEFFIRRVRR